MIVTREIALERVVARVGSERVDNASLARPETLAATGFPVRRAVPAGTSLFDFALPVARACLDGIDPAAVRGVIVATFSHEMRFPALAVRLASALGLNAATPAFDVQLACSAYPYAVYLAGRLAADANGKVLVVDGDIQSRLTAASEPATRLVLGDAVTATLVTAGASEATSPFAFLSDYGEALTCPAEGPVAMEGFKVFSFVATRVTALVREVASAGARPDLFVPHGANAYMVRQLAKAVGLEDRLLVASGEAANTGSSSVPLALAQGGRPGRVLIAGFGAGLSAAAGTVRLADDFTGREI